MRRGLVAFFGLATTIALGLVGCGRSPFDSREPWRDEAEAACLARKLVVSSEYMTQGPAIGGQGACGMNAPFRVAAFGAGSVALTRPATLACPIIPTIDGWVAAVVQPAAELYFGTAVAEVRAGSYSCRPRNNQRGAKLSEHSFGNALDVMAFRLTDGREVSVVKGWRGAPQEQDFLREVFVGACAYFTTVLGPGADPFHYDHFHFDLARHDARGERRVCKPLLKFQPRLDPYGQPATPQRLPRERKPYDPPPLDVEEDLHDPFQVGKGRGGPAVAARPAPRPPQERLAVRQAPEEPPMTYRDASRAAAPPRFDPFEADAVAPRRPETFDRSGLAARIDGANRFAPPPAPRWPQTAETPRGAALAGPLPLDGGPRPAIRPPHPSVDQGIY